MIIDSAIPQSTLEQSENRDDVAGKLRGQRLARISIGHATGVKRTSPRSYELRKAELKDVQPVVSLIPRILAPLDGGDRFHCQSRTRCGSDP